VFLLQCDQWEPNDSAIIHKRLATVNLIDSPFTRAIAGLELDGEPAYMALECLSGEKLARRTAGNCLAPHDALSLGRQIAKAMIAAHRVGFVHGAIDPRIIQRRHDQLWTIDSVSSTIGAVEGDSSLAIKFHTAESRRGQAEPACDISNSASPRQTAIACYRCWMNLQIRSTPSRIFPGDDANDMRICC